MSDAIADEPANTVDICLTDGVGTVDEFVGGIFLTGDQLFWVEFAVSKSANLIISTDNLVTLHLKHQAECRAPSNNKSEHAFPT